MRNNQSKKRTPLIIMGVILTLVVVAFSSITIYAKVIQPKKYSEYIKQGTQYLNENMYEEAILAFDKAIKIDEKSIEARIGASKGYVGMNNANEAGTYLLQAQKLDLKNENLTLEMIYIIKDLDKDIASKLLQNYLNAVGIDNVSDKFRDEVLESTNNEVLVDYINKAQNMYDSAVEGNQNGNYKSGSKEELLKVIEKAKKIDEGYFYTQDEIDEMTTELLAAISEFESKKVMVIPSNLGDIYRAKLRNVEETMERRLSNSDLCNAEMGAVVADAQYEYEAILQDIYADLIKYLPNKTQEINSHKARYKQAVAQQEYEYDNMDPMMVGTWMVTGVPESFANIAKDYSYDLINRYM